MSMISFRASNKSFAVIFYTDKVGLVHDRGESYFGNSEEAMNWILNTYDLSDTERTRVVNIFRTQSI